MIEDRDLLGNVGICLDRSGEMPNEMLLPLKGWMIKKASRVYTTGRQGLFEGTGLKISYFFFLKKKSRVKGPWVS